MAALSSFVPLVAPFTPGAANIVIESAARNAAIDFCARSLALQRTLATVTTTQGEDDYTLTQAGEVVAKLLSVKLDGDALELVTAAQLDAEPEATAAQAPRVVTLAAPMKVRLFPAAPIAGLDIVVRAAMRPSLASTTLDDDIFERYSLVIADGAISWLCGQVGKSYSNPQLGMERRAAFNDGIALAKEATYYSNARTAPRSRVRWC